MRDEEPLIPGVVAQGMEHLRGCNLRSVIIPQVKWQVCWVRLGRQTELRFWSELWPLASQPSPKVKIVQGQPLVPQKVVSGGEGKTKKLLKPGHEV